MGPESRLEKYKMAIRPIQHVWAETRERKNKTGLKLDMRRKKEKY